MHHNTTTSHLLKLALRVHSIYFFCYALFFEFLPLQALQFLGMSVPADLLGGIATKVAAGGLLTCAVVFWIGSREQKVSKIVIVTALIQTIYNLFHDVVGLLQFRITASPQLVIVFIDIVVIGCLCLIYLTTWLKMTEESNESPR